MRAMVKNLLVACLILTSQLQTSCFLFPGESAEKRKVATKPAKQVQEENIERLMSIPGVLGVLTGDIAGKPCIRVLVQRRTMATAKDIPHSIEGYPVVIEEGRSFRTR